jgi:DNA-binding Lrp family transcriptional regulator
MGEKLDKKDILLLTELDKNARSHNSAIAKKIGLSKESVAYRIARLEKRGILEGFQALIDATKLGMKNFRIYVKLKDADAQKREEIIGHLVASGDVWWVVSVSGNWDLDFCIWGPDVYKFQEIWERLIGEYKRHFERDRISIYTYLEHLPQDYLTGKREAGFRNRVMGGAEVARIDKLDLRILRALSTDARASLVELAQKVKASEKVVAYRMKRMEKEKIILGYRCLLNLEKLGFAHYKVDLLLNDLGKKELIKEYVRQMPEVMYIDETYPSSDVEFDPICASDYEFQEAMGKILDRFGDSIRSYEHFIAAKEIKMSHCPKKVETSP